VHRLAAEMHQTRRLCVALESLGHLQNRRHGVKE
jgi:hypothetical protein